jgi:serine/threonine protein kinase
MSMSNMIFSTLPIGTIVGGKYRVERHVGDGGMGQVFAARHLVLNELFAIKFMHHRDLANPQAAARFIREAQAVVRLKNNEHVARVHDVGKHDSGDLYIVMELLVGHDLGELLKIRGVLPIHEACSYVLQACNALVEAHELGIIHRDLKPANLFLTHRKDGSSCIKVLDFGISKVLLTEGQEAEVEMTGTREMMGSPLYMSPEQAKSARDVDERTDIWALGAILYKLITGKAPFMGQSMAEISFALLESTAVRPPSEIRRDIPRQLDACILRCLEKNVHRRYGRVSDLIVALAPFASKQSPSADDEDNAATVLRPIGNARLNLEGLAGTLPLDAARREKWSANPADTGRERSGTDVMPAYRPSENLRNDLAPPIAISGAQTTQPLDGHALRAAVQAHRPAERKPSFTGRVILPPVATQTPLPGPAPGPPNSVHQPAPFQLRASFQVPTIMPPPIPPAFPTGGYPIAAAGRTTQNSPATGFPIPDVTEPPWQRPAAKRTQVHDWNMLIPLAIVAGIGALGVAAFLMTSAPPDKFASTLEATKSASNPAKSAAPSLGSVMKTQSLNNKPVENRPK